MEMVRTRGMVRTKIAMGRINRTTTTTRPITTTIIATTTKTLTKGDGTQIRLETKKIRSQEADAQGVEIIMKSGYAQW